MRRRDLGQAHSPPSCPCRIRNPYRRRYLGTASAPTHTLVLFLTLRLLDGVTWEEAEGSAFRLKEAEAVCSLRVLRVAEVTTW